MVHNGDGDPCNGHLCDGCWTCRNGHCCRRGNANYQLPGLGEWDGPIHSELGVPTRLLNRLGLAGSPTEVIYAQVTYGAFRAYHLTGVPSKVYDNCVRAALDDYLGSDD